jgi:methionine-rich copper-binding protein CopC
MTGALLFMLSSGALAHAHLKTASPADHATVAAAMPSVRLEFSEEIELKFSGVKIAGPNKSTVTTGPATHGSGGDAVLEVPVTGPLAPGAYTLEWHILSKDGHKTKGSHTFTVKP